MPGPLAAEIVEAAQPLLSSAATASFCTDALLPVRFSLPSSAATVSAGGASTAIGRASMTGMWALENCAATRRKGVDQGHALLVLCLDGQLYVEGKRQSLLTAGNMFLFRSRDYRFMQTLSPVSTLSLRFPAHWLACLAPGNFSESFLECSVDARQGIAACGRQLLLSYWLQRSTLPPMADRMLAESALRFVVQGIAGNAGMGDTNLSQQSCLLRLRDAISARLIDQQEISIAALAEDIGLSVRGLQASLRQCGTTTSAEVRRARLARAAELLVSPANIQQSVSHVAFSVGFDDLSSFSRQFKAQYGLPPSKYREERIQGTHGRSPTGNRLSFNPTDKDCAFVTK